MTRKVFRLVHQQARELAAKFCMEAPEGVVVTFAEPTRSSAANARMWAMLGEIAEQVTWHGQKLDSESWKAIFTAALKKYKVVPGIDGGMVVLGQSTSKMSKTEMSDLMELMAAFGAEHNVKFVACA